MQKPSNRTKEEYTDYQKYMANHAQYEDCPTGRSQQAPAAPDYSHYLNVPKFTSGGKDVPQDYQHFAEFQNYLKSQSQGSQSPVSFAAKEADASEDSSKSAKEASSEEESKKATPSSQFMNYQKYMGGDGPESFMDYSKYTGGAGGAGDYEKYMNFNKDMDWQQYMNYQHFISGNGQGSGADFQKYTPTGSSDKTEGGAVSFAAAASDGSSQSGSDSQGAGQGNYQHYIPDYQKYIPGGSGGSSGSGDFQQYMDFSKYMGG
ncbi:unnamed protein product, partial [Symbiodinium pilosum]